MTQTKTAEGCCSAISPCSHQQRDPTTICDVCNRAAPTQETTPAFNPRLDECVALIQAYEKTLADRVVAYSSSAPMPRRDADCRLADARRRLADAAREAIPQLIAMVRVKELERDEVRAQTSQVAKVLAWEPPYQAGLHKRVETIIHRAEVAEARAAAAEAKVKELEALVEGLLAHPSNSTTKLAARAALRR